MPGIFGIIDTSAPAGRQDRDLRDLVEAMAAAMKYEPSYSTDIVSIPEAGACVGRVGFAWRRDGGSSVVAPSLAVLSAGEARVPSDDMPNTAVPGNARCVGAGASELCRALLPGDTSVLALVGGAFAGIVIDSRERRSLLFNDRSGVERIFTHEDGSRLFFSSEAKAILAVAPRTRAIDDESLAELLACGGTLGDRSLFRHIDVLAPGSVLTIQGTGRPRRARYCDPSTLEALASVEPDAFDRELSASLSRAVTGAIVRGPKAGVSLTGGLDSRMVMASAECEPWTLPCYTFGSMYHETLDVAVGRQVAATMRQPHTVLTLDRQFLADIRESFDRAVYVSDGYIGLSGASELYLNRRARVLAPVRITGNWGGELMRGVRAFKHDWPRAGLLTPEMQRLIAESAERFAAASRAFANPLWYALFHQMPVQGYGRYAVERSQVLMRAPFLDDQVVRWLYRAPASVRSSHASAAAVIARRPELLAIPTDIGLLGTDHALARQVRQLRRRLLVKSEYLISHGAPDWVASLTASPAGGRIERLFIGRNKFQHFRRWMRAELSGFIRDALHDAGPELGEFFDVRRVARAVEDQIAGRANYTDEIDKILTVAAAARLLLKAPTAARSELPPETLAGSRA